MDFPFFWPQALQQAAQQAAQQPAQQQAAQQQAAQQQAAQQPAQQPAAQQPAQNIPQPYEGHEVYPPENAIHQVVPLDFFVRQEEEQRRAQEEEHRRAQEEAQRQQQQQQVLNEQRRNRLIQYAINVARSTIRITTDESFYPLIVYGEDRQDVNNNYTIQLENNTLRVATFQNAFVACTTKQIDVNNIILLNKIKSNCNLNYAQLYLL